MNKKIFLKHFIEQIRANELTSAIDDLYIFCKKNKQFDSKFLSNLESDSNYLSGQWSGLEDKRSRGVISVEDANLIESRIRDSLVKISENIKKQPVIAVDGTFKKSFVQNIPNPLFSSKNLIPKPKNVGPDEKQVRRKNFIWFLASIIGLGIVVFGFNRISKFSSEENADLFNSQFVKLQAYVETGNHDAALNLADTLLRIAFNREDSANVLNLIGDVCFNKKQYGKALKNYNQTLKRCKNGNIRASLACMKAYGKIAKLYYDSGNYDFAKNYLDSVFLLRNEMDSAKSNLKYLTIADALLLEALMFKNERDLKKSDKSFKQAKSYYKDSLLNNIYDLSELGIAEYNRLHGQLHIFSNEFDEAEREFSEALKIYEEYSDNDKFVYRTKPKTAAVYSTLGALYRHKGVINSDEKEMKKSDSVLIRAKEIYTELDEKYKWSEFKYELGIVKFTLGNTFFEKAKYKDAEYYFNGAKNLFERILNDQNDEFKYKTRINLSKVYRGLAAVFREEKNFDEAIKYLKMTIRNYNELVNQNPKSKRRFNYEIAVNYYNCALVYNDLGKKNEAKENYSNCIEILENHQIKLDTYEKMARMYLDYCDFLSQNFDDTTVKGDRVKLVSKIKTILDFPGREQRPNSYSRLKSRLNLCERNILQQQ